MTQKLQGRAIEYNLTEHCNLRCAGCDHASPLLPKRFADLDGFRRDLETLGGVFHARELKLLGGEHLLHPQLMDFLKTARRIGIADGVTLVTNGVLLHRADEALFEHVDKLWVSLYPGVTVRADLSRLGALSRRQGFTLRVRRIAKFRETLVNVPHGREEVVEKIYRECGMAHTWSCHTVYEGYYYKCSPAPFLEARLAQRGVEVRNRAEDGIPIHDNPRLKEQLADYLASERPLRACSYCLGSSGREFPHRQLDRDGVQRALHADEGDPEEQLERSRIQRARRALVRISGLSYS